MYTAGCVCVCMRVCSSVEVKLMVDCIKIHTRQDQYTLVEWVESNTHAYTDTHTRTLKRIQVALLGRQDLVGRVVPLLHVARGAWDGRRHRAHARVGVFVCVCV
jgi:hypothetical protein